MEQTPWGVRLFLRLMIFGLITAVIVVPLYRAGVAFRTVEFAEQCSSEAELRGMPNNDLAYAQRFSLCMFLKGGFIEAWLGEPALLHVMSLPSAACARVGVWQSTRKQTVYTVTLHDDSSFIAEPVVDLRPSAGPVSGYWGENQGVMIWIYDNGLMWPPDINRIENQTPGRFTLVEANGERTEFSQKETLDSQRCPA